jgi:hypothetical protein
MNTELRETLRLTMTRIVSDGPTEVAFFLHDRDGNHVHSGSMLFSDVGPRFKAAFGTSDQSLDTLERDLKNRREIDQLLRDETYSSLRVAGLLPPAHVAPQVGMEIHVDARKR